MSASDSKIVKTEPLNDEDAKWTKLILTTYTDPNGTTRTWEHAERRTRPAGSPIDGVGIVAILSKETGPEIILQKQYRPPINKVTIEVPAGLVDEGETAEQAAVRELKEETGYIGVVSETSPVMFNGGFVASSACSLPTSYKMFYNPGFCNTNLKMVHVTIDMSNPENQNPKPELEENEFIEVFTVKLKDLWENCKRLEKEGYAIDARVGTVAEGIEIAKQWKF